MTDFDFDIGMDYLREEHNRLENPNKSGFGNNFVRINDEGPTVVRILPPAQGKRLYCATRLHPINERNYHCLRTLDNGKWRGSCPICDEYNGLYDRSKKAKSKEDEETLRAKARTIKPYERYYYNVIVRKEYVPETQETLLNVGPKILSIGKILHARVLRAIFGDEKAEEPGLGNIAHPIKGRDFKIIKMNRKSPEGVFANYDQSKFLDVSLAGTPEQVQTWMASLHDLQLLRDAQLKSFEEIGEQVQIFLGFKADADVATAFEVKQEAPATQEKRNSPVVDSAPFGDDDMGGVEDAFIRELQELTNRS